MFNKMPEQTKTESKYNDEKLSSAGFDQFTVKSLLGTGPASHKYAHRSVRYPSVQIDRAQFVNKSELS